MKWKRPAFGLIVGSSCCLLDLLWILCHLSAVLANTCQRTIDFEPKYCFRVFIFYTYQFVGFFPLHIGSALLPISHLQYIFWACVFSHLQQHEIYSNIIYSTKLFTCSWLTVVYSRKVLLFSLWLEYNCLRVLAHKFTAMTTITQSTAIPNSPSVCTGKLWSSAKEIGGCRWRQACWRTDCFPALEGKSDAFSPGKTLQNTHSVKRIYAFCWIRPKILSSYSQQNRV